jgi:hypothetical protein
MKTMYCEFCPADGAYCSVCECEMREMARLRQATGKPALRLPGREIYQPHDNSTALSAAVVLACAMASLGLLVFKIIAG